MDGNETEPDEPETDLVRTLVIGMLGISAPGVVGTSISSSDNIATSMCFAMFCTSAIDLAVCKLRILATPNTIQKKLKLK